MDILVEMVLKMNLWEKDNVFIWIFIRSMAVAAEITVRWPVEWAGVSGGKWRLYFVLVMILSWYVIFLFPPLKNRLRYQLIRYGKISVFITLFSVCGLYSMKVYR